MERCKTCSHWEFEGKGEYGVIRGGGVCRAARQIWDVAETKEPDYEQMELLPEHAGLLCMVADGSQYSARLMTMPDFGCVMHKKADQSSANTNH